MLSVFPPKIPSDKSSGIKKRKIWKRNTMLDDMITPNKTVLAFSLSFKTIEDINIKIKAEKIK